jgi:membrane protein involved in colicin uptake
MAAAHLAIALWLCLGASVALAQTSKQDPPWSQLSAQQQQILAPIQGEWDKLDPTRKRKWLGIAQRYPKMQPAEQERLQRRMKEWVTLTPEQRRAAREKYREFELLPQEERQAMREKWERYKQELDRERAEGAHAADVTAEKPAGGGATAPSARPGATGSPEQ